MEFTRENAPLVSVIVPAYNAHNTLEETVRSVLAQTICDLELILIDDCSSDDTHTTARRLSDGDSRIRFVRNEENLGAAKTRNRGISLARGEWIAFLDSDDIWHPDKLALQLELARRTGARLIYTSYRLFSDETGLCRDYIVPAHTDYKSMLRENVIGCSTVLIHRSVLENRRFSEDIYHEDYALWLSILKAGIPNAGCTEVLTDWRVSSRARSFNKRSAAMHRWHILRRVERLPLHDAIPAFIAYAVRGLKKHKRI